MRPTLVPEPSVRGSRETLPRIVLDTNILLLPFERSFPLEAELARWTASKQIAVPSAIVGELTRLEARGRSDARLAIQLASRYLQVPSRKPGDDGILELASRLGAWVVTSDRALHQRLRRAGIPVLHPRGVRLELDPGLPRSRVRRKRVSARFAPSSSAPTNQGSPPKPRNP